MMTFKEKILQEIEEIPEAKKLKLLKIIQLLVAELTPIKKPTSKRGSLNGIWKGAKINDDMYGREHADD